MRRTRSALLCALLLIPVFTGLADADRRSTSGGGYGGRSSSRSASRPTTRSYSTVPSYRPSVPRVSLSKATPLPRTRVVVPRTRTQTVVIHHTYSRSYPYYYSGSYWPTPQVVALPAVVTPAVAPVVITAQPARPFPWSLVVIGLILLVAVVVVAAVII